jgi:NifU-like protein involved in Fe-S cluster formation
MPHLKSQVAGQDDPLYRRDLLRLAADARGAGSLPDPDGVASRHNPACGDRITVELTLADGRITALAHQTQACVLCQGSAALLAAQAPGLDRAGLAALAGGVRAMLQGGPPPAPPYAALMGAVGHAGRHVCVLLPLDAALAALEQAEEGRVRPQA